MTEKVLLVDDEPGIRKVLGLTLTDMGYRVFPAQDGETALAIFRHERPTIVFTDIKMPGMDGIELLRQIKQLNAETEVIMISGHGDMDLAIESLKFEACDFITKPINSDALEIALKRAVEKITMRRQLQEYTTNLEALVEEKTAKLLEVERMVAVNQAVEGLSTAMSAIADDLEGGIRYFNEMPCFVSIHNPSLRIVAINQLYAERIGNQVGQHSGSVYACGKTDSGRCPAAKTFATGKGQRSKETIAYRNGREGTVIVHTAPIRNSDGDIALVVEISADITEIRRLQEQLHATQDNLSTLGLMVGSISHGIKGVLTGLDAGLYDLESGAAKNNSGQVAEGIATVRRMVERIRHVVLNILYYSKDRQLKYESVDVHSMLAEVRTLVASKIAGRSIAVDSDFGEVSARFEVDPVMMQTALVNILENAVEACLADTLKPEHAIRLTAEQSPSAITIGIEDNAAGMDEEAKNKLFSLFFSSKGHAGTGLGMFIAKNIIERHNGQINVTSQPGKGSHFRITVPNRQPKDR